MVSNKKGFTLVEVLTVIVILGILSTIGIVTVVNIRKNQAVKFDQTQRELFKETAKTYFSDHKSQLPMINNQENRVYLVDLINENYIDSLLDYHKKSYQKDKSYVSVKKVASRYVYTVNLLKEGETGDDYIVSEDKNPIDINFDNYQNKDGKMNATTNNGETKHYTNKTAKVDIEIEVQDEIGIAAFNYSIYKNGKKVYTSEYIEPNGTRAKDTIILDLNEYGDGEYKIGVEVYDMKDHYKSGKSDKIVIDRVAPKIILKATSSEAKYNSTTAKVTVNISDNNATKYELSTSNFSTKTYEQMTISGVNGDNTTSMNVHSSYDGTNKTIYVTVKDIAGNEAKAKTTYTIYKNCTKTVANGNPTYGACSANCGSGTRVQTQSMKDTYLGTPCSSIKTTVSCGTLPPCCTGPTTTYTEWSTCSKKCTRNSVVGTQTRTKTVTQCDGTSVTTSETQKCNQQTCCSSVYLKSCSASCGIGKKKAYSNYDDKSCSKKDKPCKETTCTKNKCYVGNTLVDANKPSGYGVKAYGCENKGGTSTGYWIYCTDSKGKLWTQLKKNDPYKNSKPPHSQFACANNKIKEKSAGDKIKIDGTTFTVIKDSKTFWKSCSSSVYKG